MHPHPSTHLCEGISQTPVVQGLENDRTPSLQRPKATLHFQRHHRELQKDISRRSIAKGKAMNRSHTHFACNLFQSIYMMHCWLYPDPLDTGGTCPCPRCPETNLLGMQRISLIAEGCTFRSSINCISRPLLTRQTFPSSTQCTWSRRVFLPSQSQQGSSCNLPLPFQ